MKTNVRRVALSGIICALEIVILYIGSLLPTLRLATAAIAGTAGAIVVLRFGLGAGGAVYAVTSAIAFLLPSRSVALVYILLFGHYPITKSLAERTGKPFLEWLIKLAVFNAALTAAVLIFSALIYDLAGRELLLPVLYLVGNAAFVLYDMAFSGIVDMYLKRFPLK